jgi:bifunctional UDP-N-acetylglucosamine pyrophosphorylase/glucosamine-1-phosphate N-acetyltransferase
MERVGIVILAAGLGTRMRSSQAKVLHCLSGQPLLTHVIKTTQRLHPDRMVVVVGHQAKEVQRRCGTVGVEFALQREQRGTGDAVRAAQSHLHDFSGDILIVCGDTPLLTTNTLAQFVRQHQDNRAVLSVLTVCLDDPGSYGRVIRHPDGQVCKIVEARDATPQERAVHEINSGIYCVRADFLFPALERLQPANVQKEYYLTDIVAQAVTAGLPTHAIITHDPHEVGGINSREDLAIMEKTRQAQLRSQWMAAGVTFEDPDTVYIGEEVTIGQDTVIGPNTQLKGKTVIGARCQIDGSAYIVDSTIGNDVHVLFSVVIKGSEIGNQASVGPFSHLRGEVVLDPKAEVGNFVEVKKSRIGQHSKAKHLAYIGDTEIGRDSNIGAGTITCNYDGFRKHKTKIGDRVQVGSDTTLVAPITINDDVYIATATTVRQDVPAGALVFNTRQEQVREGWTAAKRAKETAKK